MLRVFVLDRTTESLFTKNFGRRTHGFARIGRRENRPRSGTDQAGKKIIKKTINYFWNFQTRSLNCARLMSIGPYHIGLKDNWQSLGLLDPNLQDCYRRSVLLRFTNKINNAKIINR